MDLLRSSSAPFVIAALLSILGWHIGTLTKDIRDTRSVVYEVNDRSKGTISAVVTNVSKSQLLEGATFALVCDDLDPCLDFGSRSVVLFPPTATDSISLSGDDTVLGFKVDLAAGGRIGVSARRKTNADVHFFFFPKGLPFEEEEELLEGEVPPHAADANKTNAKDIYVLDGGTWRGWVVLNYFNLVLASFFVVLMVFVLGTLALGLKRPGSRRADKDGEHAAGAEVTSGSGDAT